MKYLTFNGKKFKIVPDDSFPDSLSTFKEVIDAGIFEKEWSVNNFTLFINSRHKISKRFSILLKIKSNKEAYNIRNFNSNLNRIEIYPVISNHLMFSFLEVVLWIQRKDTFNLKIKKNKRFEKILLKTIEANKRAYSHFYNENKLIKKFLNRK